MPNVNSVQMFVVACSFNKNLIIEIIEISRHKYMNVSHNFQDIQALFQSLTRKMCLCHNQSITLSS